MGANYGKCKKCGGQCESWARVCDDCADAQYIDYLLAEPDRTRCKNCGGIGCGGKCQAVGVSLEDVALSLRDKAKNKKQTKLKTTD